MLGLGVEVSQVAKLPGGKEAVSYETYSSLDASLLIAPCHRHRARLVAVVGGQIEQRGVKADGVADALGHRRAQIVVEQDSGHPTKRFEGTDVAAQEAGHLRTVEEAQEDLAGVAEHHHEAHQLAARTAHLHLAEVSPVHLCLLAR